MRILVTADLHYDIQRSRDPVRELARRACALGGDALVLVGDTAGADLGPLCECLRLFEPFAGRKLMVAGNHCLWCRPEEDSLHRYERVLPRVVEEEGFQLLDHMPAVLDGTGLVGSVGWYDYSFRDESLGIPEAFYRAKVAPGAAAYLGGHTDLLTAHRHVLTDAHMSMGARWMDGEHIRLGVARHLAEVSARAERVVAFLHHLPFADLVPKGRPPLFAFAAAYMGAGRLGKALLQCPKVSHVYCGHSHWPAEMRIGPVKVVNVGSTYSEKQLEVLDL
jgi:predicted phosphohydrolase